MKVVVNAAADLFFALPLLHCNMVTDCAIRSILGALHMLAHITAVLSLGAGAVSFTHIVKAAEPVFTAGFSALILGQASAVQ